MDNGRPDSPPAAGKSTIGRRISALVAAAVLTSVLLITATSSAIDFVSDVEGRKQSLQATGYVFAAALAEQVAAHDAGESLRVLRSISRIPEISYAAVLDETGRPIAALGSTVLLDGARFRTDFGAAEALTTGAFPVAVDIIKAGRKAGQVLLIADVSDLRSELLWGLAASLLVAALASLAGIALARRLQSRITAPMRHLTETMQRIAATRDYEAHIEHASEDRETSMLIDSFNAMIREIRARDQALGHYSRNLETTVAERTRDLREARDAAELANQAKSSFLSTMSHEIRTPLNGLMVMAELLAGAGLERRLNRYAEVIVKSGQSLLTIINDVLDLSKIEAGKMEIESIALDPAAIADDVVSLFHENATSKGLDLAVRVAANVPRSVAGDPVRLNQILSNLVNNALKFTSHGQILVSLHYGEGFLTMMVADSGIGIPGDKLASLFQAFSQADQSITRRFGGTGLGLAICKRLADAMGGGITVLSEPGRGAQFTVRVAAPMLEPPRAQARAPQPGFSAGLAFPGNASLSALGTALVSAGYRVEVARNGSAHYGVIFAPAGKIEDLGLASGQRPLIIGLSGLGDSSGEAAIAAGLADDLLSLPLRPDEIHDLLHRLQQGSLRGRSLLDRETGTPESHSGFSGRRVLVADDNAINREVIIEVLRQLGIAADTAGNGREAVEIWRRHRPDLVFMDCSMPELDGYAAAREIRAHEALGVGQSHTPIVALTAHVAGGGAEDWKHAGMDAYMTKPFTLKAIVQCLERQFEGQPLAAASDPVAGATAEDVLDPTALGEIRAIGGSGALFRRVLDLFTTRVPPAVDHVEAAARGADLEALADAVHALKSMCANIGAARAVAACHALEHAARTGGSFDVGGMTAAITREIRAALAEVQRLRAA